MRALISTLVLVAGCTFAEPADVDVLEGARLSIGSGDAQVGTVATTLAAPIVIAAQDRDGNPVADLTLEIAVTTGGGHVDMPAIKTDVQGNAHALVTLGTMPGANTIEARIPGQDTEPVSASATALVDAPATLAIASGDGQTGVAGDPLADPLVVRITDQFSNPIPNILVDLAIATGNGSLANTTATSDADGLARATFTLDTKIGANAAQASLLELPSVTFTATGIPGAPSQLLKTSGDAQSATAGATLADPLIVTVEDVHGNPVAGVAVDFVVTAGGGNVTSATVATATDGTASTTYHLGAVTGINHVEARVSGLPPLDFVASAITGSAASIAKVSGDSQSGTVNTTLGSQLVVVARDVSNNPVQGFLITFAVTSGNGTPTTATVATDATGQAKTSFKLGTIAGANTIQPRGGTLVGSSFTETGVAGAPTKVIAFQSPSGKVDASTSVTLVARTTDAFNNPVSGRTVSWVLTQGSATLTSASGTTNPNVQTTVTLGNLSDVVIEGRSTGLTTAAFPIDVRGFVLKKIDPMPGTQIRIVDLNGDARPDAVVVGSMTFTSTVEVYINTTAAFSTNATFAPRVSFFANGNQIREVATGDLTGDGKPDLLVLHDDPTVACNPCATLLVNTTVTGSTLATFSTVDLGKPDRAFSVALADINGDGKLDVLFATGIGLVILRNTGGGTFAAPQTLTLVVNNLAAVVDLNLDGVVDVLDAAGQYFRNTTPVGATVASFDQPTSAGTLAGDLDRDGKPDVFIRVTSNQASFARNLTTAGAVTLTFGQQFQTNPNFAGSGDLDLDGFPEVLAINGSGISVMHNQMTFLGFGGHFGTEKSFPFGGVLTLAMADANGDGASDVYVLEGNALVGSFTVLLAE